ncbi:hypothetical protein LIER_12137 [Lithospermum erythrorhizon]|uniref:Uncharacterized protein n=1 Tax=Lithospermum erythrorhizon TaxID=34254 RepID=A0AAV3PR77_LITER
MPLQLPPNCNSSLRPSQLDPNLILITADDESYQLPYSKPQQLSVESVIQMYFGSDMGFRGLILTIISAIQLCFIQRGLLRLSPDDDFSYPAVFGPTGAFKA